MPPVRWEDGRPHTYTPLLGHAYSRWLKRQGDQEKLVQELTRSRDLYRRRLLEVLAGEAGEPCDLDELEDGPLCPACGEELEEKTSSWEWFCSSCGEEFWKE